MRAPMTRKERLRHAQVYIRAAIVELTRASAILDTRGEKEPPGPEFYETNQAIARVDDLSDYIRRLA